MALAFAGFSTVAFAGPKVLTLTNRSGKVVSAITAKVPDAAATVVPVTFAGGLNNGASGSATFNLLGNICLVDLTVTFTPTGGSSILGFDVCNVEGLVIE